MNCQWQSLWCRVEDGVLKMYRDEASDETPQYTVQLRGSEVRPGPDTAHAYRITITQQGDQVAVLEVRGWSAYLLSHSRLCDVMWFRKATLFKKVNEQLLQSYFYQL